MSDTDADAILGLQPDDLDGHTIDQLQDYLDHGRQPADPSIDNSPACQIALSGLQQLHAVAATYLDDNTVTPDSTDQDWIARVLAVLPLEARAGRSFPYASESSTLAATITEGALRGLIRGIGDSVPGLLIGAIQIHLIDTVPATAALDIDVALKHGTPLPQADTALRAALAAELPRHAPFDIRVINVRVVSLTTPRANQG